MTTATSEILSETEPELDRHHELVSSTRIEGTPVVNARGEKLGSVHSVMIHKKTGQVVYAILSFGGFLGIGSHVHPIPWEKLAYDAQLHVYRVDLTRKQLEEAPIRHLDEADRPTIRSYDERLYEYYGVAPYWWF